MPSPEFIQLVNEAKTQVREIRPLDLAKMQQSGQDLVVVDVRERDEQARGMIPGAVALPRGIVERDIEQVTADKQKPLVVYCAGGARSALVALNLQKMGYTKVMSLSGGYKGWSDSHPNDACKPYSS